MSKWLECGGCGEMLEVSDAIADAMHRWCEELGELFVCRECASEIENFTDRELYCHRKFGPLSKPRL